MNGVLNCSILDGWWIEGYNGKNGFEIGVLDPDGTEAEADAADSIALYETLEKQVVPAFYTRDDADLPKEWISRIRSSMATLTPEFSSDRMDSEYVRRIYGAAS